MIKVLTIEREYGSGANEIAQKVSDRLGWKLWDQLLTTEIARQSGMRQACTWSSMRSAAIRCTIGCSKPFCGAVSREASTRHRLKLADAEGIRSGYRTAGAARLRQEGNCVIVGRGSAYYLQDSPDAFHVFVYAPFEEKVRRLQQTGKSEQEAIELAETVDLDRAAFIKQHFGVEWPARQYFHLMINSTIGEDAVVQSILDSINTYQAAHAVVK